MSILVHHYFISLKGNIWKFEWYISLLTSYIIFINYVSYMDQMLIFGPKTQLSLKLNFLIILKFLVLWNKINLIKQNIQEGVNRVFKLFWKYP